MREETWKPVPGAGNYMVSNNGRVAKIIPGSISAGGYHVVKINFDDGDKRLIGVHRLVLGVFEPNDNSVNLVVNHIDFNKLNNNIENLEWCTQDENIQHSVRHKRFVSKPVYCVETDTVYVSAGQAARELFNPDNKTSEKHIACKIGEVCKAEYTRTHYHGYHFRYAEDEVDD